MSRSKKHKQFVQSHRHLYNSLLRAQKGGCAICGREPSPNRRLDMDHDHLRMIMRGLLCHRCNRALPAWITPDWLRKAAIYLEKYIPKEKNAR